MSMRLLAPALAVHVMNCGEFREILAITIRPTSLPQEASKWCWMPAYQVRSGFVRPIGNCNRSAVDYKDL